MENKQTREWGGMLMELLLMLVIIGSLLPFMYRQNTRKKEAMENAAVAAELMEIRSALEEYVEDKGDDLKGSLGGEVYTIPFDDLYGYGLSNVLKRVNKYGQIYSVKVRKLIASNGVATVKGLIFATGGEMSFIQRRGISKFTGPAGGIVEDNFILGGSGGWIETTNEWRLNAATGTVVLRTEPRKESYTFIRRNSTQEIDTTMATDLTILNRNVYDVNLIEAQNIEMTGTLALSKVRTDSETGGTYQAGVQTLEVRNQATENTEDIPLILNVEVLEDLTVAGSLQLLQGLSNVKELKVQNQVQLSGDITIGQLKVYDINAESIEIKTNASETGTRSGEEDEGEKLYELTVRSLISYGQLNFTALEAPFMKVQGASVEINYNGELKDLSSGSSRKISSSATRLQDVVLIRLNRCIISGIECPSVAELLLDYDLDSGDNFEVSLEQLLTELRTDCSTLFDIEGLSTAEKEEKIRSIEFSRILRCIKESIPEEEE